MKTLLNHPFLDRHRRLVNVVTVVTGLIGIVLALASIVLPVRQTTANLDWPQAQQIQNVTAPLTAFVPIDLDLAMPCSAAAKLPANGVMLETVPSAGVAADRNGLFLRVNKDTILVAQRNVVLLNIERKAAQADPNCVIKISGDPKGIAGSVNAPGKNSFNIADPDMRPMVMGLFSDLPASTPLAGIHFHATIDTRFISTPTPLKFYALALGILMTIISVFSLLIIDARDGRGYHRLLPKGWWSLRLVDLGVIAALGLWWFIGGNTSDDGYQLTVARNLNHAGYVDNYYRYFGGMQDPFGWHYQFISLLVKVSTAGPWLRLPTLVAALLSWWILSREVIPRLGRSVRNYQPATWACAAVFLMVWTAFNNGLRPEPAIALGALLTWVAVERAVATGRLFPLAIGIVLAAFTLAIAPSGLIAVAALLVAVRPLLRRVVELRRRGTGLLVMLVPLAAAGLSVLFEIFADQTFATVREGSAVNAAVGPTNKWVEEGMRYYMLLNPTADGSIARRYGILAMFLCVLLVVVVLLRRRKPIGIAVAPTWRMAGIVLLTLFFLTFTPTKWTHQLGIFATLAGAVAASACAMAGPVLMRRRRNRTFFAAAVIFITGVSFAVRNEWWYVGNWGMSWRDQPPQLAGIQFYWVIWAVAALVAAYGLWQHFRDDYVADSTRRGDVNPELPLWQRIRVPALTWMSILVIAFIFLTVLKADVANRHSFSWASSNAKALMGEPCSLGDAVLLDADPTASVLHPATDVEGQRGMNPMQALGVGDHPTFTPDGVMPDLTADDSMTRQQNRQNETGSTDDSDGTDGTDDSSDGSGTGVGISDDGTATGSEPSGNTSSGDTGTDSTGKAPTDDLAAPGTQRVQLPFGLDPKTVPVLGSYNKGAGNLTSAWYQLPKLNPNNPIVTVAAAGSIKYVDLNGVEHDGQTVQLQVGRVNPDGTVATVGVVDPLNVTDGPTWRDLRFPRALMPPGSVVRIVVQDTSAVQTEWVAVTPPRNANLQTLQTVIGSDAPVMLDWEVAMMFPCQRPAWESGGLMEIPKWRILPDADGAWINSVRWMDGRAGGPLGIVQSITAATIIPAYVKNAWSLDWGSVQRLTPLLPAVPAKITYGTQDRNGLYTPGPMRKVGY